MSSVTTQIPRHLVACSASIVLQLLINYVQNRILDIHVLNLMEENASSWLLVETMKSGTMYVSSFNFSNGLTQGDIFPYYFSCS